MRIAYRVLLLLSVLVVCPALCVAQTAAKEATASVARHVTIRGKAAPEIMVVATIRNSLSCPRRARSGQQHSSLQRDIREE